MKDKELNKIFQRSKHVNSELSKRVYNKMQEYDKIADTLTERAWNNIEKFCKDYYQTLQKEHISKGLSLKDQSPYQDKYLSCKRMYSLDIIELLNYNKNKLTFLVNDYANKMVGCESSTSAIEIQSCYEKEELKHLLKVDDFLDTLTPLMNQREEYLNKLDNFNSK